MFRLSKEGGTTLKRVVSAFVGVSTILSLSGFALVASAVAPADYGLKEGDVISAAGSDDPDVYIVNELGYKRLFLNPVIFGFYGHLGGFAAVKNVSATTRDAFGTSGLFRNCETNDPKVYGVETTGEDTGLLHWVNTSGAQAVADDPNFFKKVFCINNNEFNWYAKGSDYTSVNQVPNYSRTPGVTTGPISVSLASTNPAPTTIVDGQARAHLADFMLSGNSAVTGFKLKRIGVSADASLTNIYLYDGTRRLTDSATVSDSTIFFNDAGGLFTVSGSKVISVMADVDGTAGETVGVQAIEVNGNAVGPVSGNMHTIATATLATATFGSVTPSDGDDSGDDDDNGNTSPADDVSVWQSTVTVGQRYVWLRSLQLRVIGSVVAGDVQNFRLLIDGVQAGNAVAQQDANGYIVFDLTSSPKKLETGGRVFKILANVVGGSNKEFYLSLRQKPDVWVVDSQYNAAVLSSSTFPIGDVDNDIEIDTGTLSITKKTDSPSGDVVKDATGVVLARFEVKASGERMKVENLHISNDSTNNSLALRNAALFLDGVQVGSLTTLWEDDATASDSDGEAEVTLGSSMIVVPGTPRTLEIRADIYDASGTNNVAADQTVTANIEAGSSNVQRLTTLDYVSAPSSVTSGNQLTIKTGSFTAGKYTGYANQSVVAPKTGVKLGHYTMTAASSEDVAVNTLTFDAVPTVTASLSGDFTDAYVKVWNDAGTLIYTSPTKSSFAIASSNSYSVNLTIPKNKTYQVELWANVTNTFDSASEKGGTAGDEDVVTTNFEATGTTTGSSTSVSATSVAGQTITSAAGTLSENAGSVPANRLVSGAGTVTATAFSFTPAYDDFTIDEIYVDLSSTTASSTGGVATLYLKDGSTTLASAVVNSSTGSASFTGLNLPIPQVGGTKTLTVDVLLASVGVGANDTGGLVNVRFDGYKYRNSGGSITTENGASTTTFDGADLIVHDAYPTVTNASLPSTTLTAGTQTLFKTVIGASGGSVALHQLVFNLTRTTSGPTIANSTFKVFEDGVDITSLGTVSTATGNFNLATDATGNVAFRFTSERIITSSKTYELRGTVGGTLTSGYFITTKIANTSTSAITDDAATVRGTLSATTPTITWSDQSTVSHSTSTDDWMNDYLVQTLGVSQTLQVP